VGRPSRIAGSADWEDWAFPMDGVEVLTAATVEEEVEVVAKEPQLERRMDLATARELHFEAASTVGEMFPAE
jgi:hypothetical protein